MIRFRRQPIPGKGTPHKDVLAGRLKESRRTQELLRRALRSENAAMKRLPAKHEAIPAHEIPVILYLEAFFVLLLCFAHTSFAGRLLPTLFNPLLFQQAVPGLVLLLGYRLSRRAAETNVGFYRKRYFTDILGPVAAHYMIPLFLVFLVYQILLRYAGQPSGTPLSLIFDLLYGRWAESSYFGVLAVLLTLLFPILLQMRKGNRRRFPFWLMHVFFFSVLYEIFMNSFEHLSFSGDLSALYRMLPFRFVFTFALGMYIYHRRKRSKKAVYYIISFVFGLLYLLTIFYLLLQNGGKMPDFIPLFHGYPFQSMLAALYLFPVLALIIYSAQRNALPKALHVPLALFGKAAYYILCVEFLFFSLKKVFLFSFSPHGWLDALLTMFSCSVGGLLFYLLSLTPIPKAIGRGVSILCYSVYVGIVRGIRGIMILWCNLRLSIISLRLRRLQKSQNLEG